MLLALLVAVAPASEVHFSVAAGFGAAYGYSGLHAEVSIDHFALFAGAGLGMFVIPNATSAIESGPSYSDPKPHLPIALGARWSMRPDGGLFVAVTGCTMGYTYTDDYRTLTGNRAAVTATAGYRWSFDPLFLELAVGGGIAKVVDDGFSDWQGVQTPPQNQVGFQPDGALALGVRF